MDNSFGETLREVRIKAGVGLRELARLIKKSAGYLSDMENGRVPPPSEAVILQIAYALNVEKETLLSAARKVDPELSRYVAERPQAADFLRMAKDEKWENGEWERFTQIAKLARLGKGEEKKP
jgi:transcriptional regulator with XRE-family HTH domain